MPSCECCWADAQNRACAYGQSVTDHYNAVMQEHQDRKCACTQKTPEGDKARAGQFWKDGRDTRTEKQDA